MITDIRVPLLPESVSDATVSIWHKKVGETVKRNETLVELETDKVMLEVPAPAEGILKEILKNTGEKVQAETIIARLDTEATASTNTMQTTATEHSQPSASTATLGPSARRAVSEHEVDVSKVKGTGKGGRITKENILNAAQQALSSSTEKPSTPSNGDRTEQRVPMTRIRTRIAERLLAVTQQTAMLTTFNEVNMAHVMDLRSRYRELFEKKYHVKLGFMSFFVRAAVEALKRSPVINASLDGEDIIYHNYFDIGVAVSTDRGLVVPILRDADLMSMAAIEMKIGEFAEKARQTKLTLEEMQGGTFTITNGGVFGSLLSTPILNSPQSAILGMHKIQERPVVENGQVVIRPMMYLALSYDHRLVDGKEAVSCLVAIKEMLEDPSRFVLEV